MFGFALSRALGATTRAVAACAALALGSLLGAALPMSAAAAAPASGSTERTAVVLVFDGVAARVLDTAPTPTFERLRREGAWTHELSPPFPSNSLVGGFTLSTGCQPARHGIVNNRFEDPERGFYDHSSDADWLLACEGLHEVAERQGVKSAALGWYGRRSSERGALASVVADANKIEQPGDERRGDSDRASAVVQLLERRDADRPRLVLAYFGGPDNAEHFSGFDSEETAAAVAAMDAQIAQILAAIEAQPAGRKTALFVTTDHGMIEATTIVNIARLLGWHEIPARAVSTGASAYLYFEDPQDDAAIEAARAALASYEQLDAWRPAAAPAWAQIGTSERVGQLVVTTLPPYFIEDAGLWPAYLRWMGSLGPRFAPASLFMEATHGYPPHQVPEVRGVLYAWGDGIARGREAGPADATALHPSVLHWLGLAPGRPLDGAVFESLFAD